MGRARPLAFDLFMASDKLVDLFQGMPAAARQRGHLRLIAQFGEKVLAISAKAEIETGEETKTPRGEGADGSKLERHIF